MSYDPNSGTSSDFGAAFPARGTAVGFKDGTNNLAPGHVDGSGNLLVNVAAGGAGGGLAQTQVRSNTNVWTDVGYSGGNLNMPVQFAGSLPAGTNVIGHVISDSGSTTAVTGNVTVVQPTGTNLHVVVDTAPTTAVTNAGLSNLDVALSTRLKPADTLAGVTTVAAVTAITNALPAGSNLLGKVGIDQTTPGTTNRVDIGNIPHVIVDTAPTTAVTNAGLTNIDVALSTRLKPADTLAGVTTVAAVTAITNALPTGSNKIGQVAIDQTTPGTTNLVQVGGSLPAGSAVIGHVIVDTAPTTTVTGTVTANQGGAPWSDDITDRAARLLGHVTVDSAPTTAVTIADGAFVTDGLISDTAVLADNAGSVSAKLRGMNFAMDQLRQDVKQTNSLLFLILDAINSNNATNANQGMPVFN